MVSGRDGAAGILEHAGVTELLAEIFSSKVRAVVLSYLLPRPHLGFSLTDLSRRLDLPISSLQHECYKLERIGVLTARRTGNVRLYRVDPRCALHAALTRLIAAAIGAEQTLQAAVEGVPGLDLAFLTGALPGPDGSLIAPPPGQDALLTPHLVLVGEIPLDALESLVARVERGLGVRPGRVELAFFRPDDWRLRVDQRNAYVWTLLTAPRLMLHGRTDAARPVPAGGMA